MAEKRVTDWPGTLNKIKHYNISIFSVQLINVNEIKQQNYKRADIKKTG